MTGKWIAVCALLIPFASFGADFEPYSGQPG
jgi:hypothetical protein